MAAKQNDADLEVIATTLIRVMKETFKSMCQLEFSQDPAFVERNLIEYESRMQVDGLQKFNAPCYSSSVSFYKSQQDQKNQLACGAMNLYLLEDVAVKILKTLGYTDFNEEDDTMILDNCGEFCNIIAGNYKTALAGAGFADLYLSDPVKEKNMISAGVEFPYNQYTYYETDFFLWKEKAVIVDVVMEK